MIEWRTTKILLNLDKVEIDKYHFRTSIYTDSGLKINESEFNKDGSVQFVRIWHHYDDEFLKEFIERDALENLIHRELYSRLGEDQFDTITTEFEGGFKNITAFSNLDFSNGYQSIVTDEENTFVSKHIHLLNDSDQLIELIEMNEEGDQLAKTQYFYDESADNTRTTHFEEGEIKWTETYEYCDQKYLITKIRNEHQHNFETIDTYERDSDGRETYATSRINGALVFENKIEYDSEGNLETEEFFDLNYWEKSIRAHERLVHEIWNQSLT